MSASMAVSRRLMIEAVLIVVFVATIPLAFASRFFGGLQPVDYALFLFSGTLPSGLGLAIAYLLARSYSSQSEASAITFGGGMLMWAWTGIASIVFVFVTSTLNPSWAIQQLGLLFTSLLNFLGVFAARSSFSKASARLWVALTYGSVTAVAAISSYAAYEGFTSSLFFIGGGTLLDLLFTSGSIILFLASSIFFLRKVSNDDNAVYYRAYSLGLVLFAVATIPRFWGPGGVGTVFSYSAVILAGCACFFIAALRRASKE